MRDLYQEVTDKILSQLEQGCVPWVRPWISTEPHGGMPYNAVSGKHYRGINVALLGMACFPSSGWLTYKQAQDIGANVRKGEKGSTIVFYKPFAVKDKNAIPDASGNVKEKLIPLLKSFTVFNVAQIDNLPERLAPIPDSRSEIERHALADTLLAKAQISHGGDRAYYQPSTDSIRLPNISQFSSAADYYGTALHELTHWTGHTSRLSREYGKRFGDEAYAREELVAEMGAAFSCAYCGIAGKLQHSEYIANWIQVLKGDKKAVLVAAGAAQKAADFITGYVPELAQAVA
jgi:antirestriction protein ArdC